MGVTKMLDLVLSVDWIEEDGEPFKGTAVAVETKAAREPPAIEGVNTEFDLTAVDHIALSNGRIIRLYWANNIFGSEGDPLVLNRDSTEAALIVAEGCGAFVCRTEPTLDGRVGIVIEDEKRRVRFVGVGDVLETKNGIEFVSHGNEVYPWRRGNPSGCAHTDWAKKKKR
jgi:hypothetical protein